MDRVGVGSSCIASLGYDERTNTLEVEFTSGRIYQYDGVPPDVYEDFLQSGSKGQYFNFHIKPEYSGSEA